VGEYDGEVDRGWNLGMSDGERGRWNIQGMYVAVGRIREISGMIRTDDQMGGEMCCAVL
jgi:hypothetical protein